MRFYFKIVNSQNIYKLYLIKLNGNRGSYMTAHVLLILLNKVRAGPRSAVGNMSGYRCVSDCRSRGREFDPGPVPYFRGD